MMMVLASSRNVASATHMVSRTTEKPLCKSPDRLRKMRFLRGLHPSRCGTNMQRFVRLSFNPENSKRSFVTGQNQVLKTPLHDFHTNKLKGKMSVFCGWSLPIVYPDAGVIDSQKNARSNAALFDVSHMLQIRLYGPDREAFVEKICVGDLQALKVGRGRYTLMTNENGGIIDDLICCKHAEYFQLVLNAGCRDKDLKHIHEQLYLFKQSGKLASIEVLDNTHGLVSLQGPKAMNVLMKLIKNTEGFDLTKFPFMATATVCTIGGIKQCTITRCGYTGEDGFEISIPIQHTEQMAEQLLASPLVSMSGLGSRDILRLEAGLCLYGHDLSEDVSPVEASLSWTISKRRRTLAGFLGSDKILQHFTDGVLKKRVGMVLTGNATAREGCSVVGEGNTKEELGVVTSGLFSPSIKKPISMGYVKTEYAKPGTTVNIEIRGKFHKAIVTKMPFVQSNYYKLPE